MGRSSVARPIRTTTGGRALAFASMAIGVALGLSAAGCGKSSTDGEKSSTGVVDSASDSSGFQLPPDFKVVEIPLEKRKEVFKKAHDIRALAVQEANQELPMDEASLPIGDTAAFDKRVADHKAIIDRILAKNLPVLAEEYGITVADVEKIEEEASRLRWLPPQDPVLEVEPTGPEDQPQGKDAAKAEG